MKDLHLPLDEEELDQLDHFLLNRLYKNLFTGEIDEGIFDISTLDGFLTAVVSGPIMIPPSVWLPVVWGDFEPEWESTEAFSNIFSLIVRHMNGITQILTEFPNEFEPIFLEHKVEGKTYTVVDEWCEGYQRGVELSFDQWVTGYEEVATLLAPIYAFTKTTEWKGHGLPREEIEKIQLSIAPNAKAIHAYWLGRDDDHSSPYLPMRHCELWVGHNDPCPCGSGKKYRKCCLH